MQDSGIMEIAHCDGQISGAELADLLGLTRDRVNVLVRDGVIPKTARGRYSRRAAVRGYCAHLREHAARVGRPTLAANEAIKEAKLRREIATAEQLELKNGAARGELLPAAEVERAWRVILADTRAALLAVPSRVGTRLPALTPHDVGESSAEIRAALERLADGTS
jgi:terminase small subunit / prophage DNA-packing protein